MFHEGNIFTGWLLLFTLLSSLHFTGILQYNIINSAFGKEASVYKSLKKKDPEWISKWQMVGTVFYHAEAIHMAGRLPGTEHGTNKLWPYTTDGKQCKGPENLQWGKEVQQTVHLWSWWRGVKEPSSIPRLTPLGSIRLAQGSCTAMYQRQSGIYSHVRSAQAQPQRAVQPPAFGAGDSLLYTRLKHLCLACTLTAGHSVSPPPRVDLPWLKQQQRCLTKFHSASPSPH